MKLLHCADLHLDTPFSGRTEAQVQYLRQQLRLIPGKLASLCRKEGCDLMLLSGDLFDGPWTQESLNCLRSALADAEVPVFISPGNHDFCSHNSPYLSETWPNNVHIFTKPHMESLTVDTLDCRIYGAGFTAVDCPPLLQDFHAEGSEKYHIAVIHGDPTVSDSPYNPISDGQIRQSGLDYLALGHIHKNGSLRSGTTLCAWPGCPMGRGYDETGTKGVLLVTLDETAQAEFVPLDTPRFYDHEASGRHAEQQLANLLPAAGSEDFYRITFVGEGEAPNIAALERAYSHFPNLTLRDRTVPPKDIWGTADADSLEGVYFRMLKDAMADADENTREALTLAARISRQILDGQEVVLP